SLCIDYQNKLESNLNLLARVEKFKKAIDADTEKLPILQVVIEGTASIDKGDPIIQQLYELRQEGIRLQELRRRVKTLFEQIQQRSAQIDSMQSKLTHLDKLEKFEEMTGRCKDLFEQFNEVSGFNNRYQSVNSQLKDLEAQLKRVENDYGKMVNSYTEILTEAGRCPTCHSPITPEVVREISENIRLAGM
ncbi:MAG: hypothetical protein ABFC94_10530, partial [Syntrophomonas sp.]